MITLLLLACVQETTLNLAPAPSIDVTPAVLRLGEPACERDCCGLFGSACCGRARVDIDTARDKVQLDSAAWDPLTGSRLRVVLDTRTCADVEPVAPAPGCEPPGSVEIVPDATVACEVVWDLVGEALPACADAAWGEPCADEPPVDGGYLTFSFGEDVAVSLYTEVAP